jgi:tryptophan synthase alpha chain
MQEHNMNKQKKILNVYCTAGYPQLHSTRVVMKALQDHGADMIELGMPYSDPLADGPVIQESNTRAIENGMTIPVMFEQLADMRSEIHIPVILMGYMNPILQYGFEAFCAKAAEVGVSGLILPDMPPHEFEYVYQSIVKKHGLNFTFLVTPETSNSRARYLDQLSSGFLYAVSASAITGSNQSWDHVVAYLNRLESLALHNPVLVGFGIKDQESFDRVAAHAHGAIVGSAYIRALAKSEDIAGDTARFLASIRPATKPTNGTQ